MTTHTQVALEHAYGQQPFTLVPDTGLIVHPTTLPYSKVAALVSDGVCPCEALTHGGGETALDKDGHCALCQCTWRVTGLTYREELE